MVQIYHPKKSAAAALKRALASLARVADQAGGTH
jgi:hypothetical protein